MDYTPGYVYELMEKGGPTDVKCTPKVGDNFLEVHFFYV